MTKNLVAAVIAIALIAYLVCAPLPVAEERVSAATRPHSASRLPRSPSGHLMTGAHEMSDLVFVILTGAFFALTALIVKGVERL